ncbi:MAG TPA: hypothetical protein VFF26_01785 [Gallionella sp.]|nr:hypothetical protein [Gallionella sp.]
MLKNLLICWTFAATFILIIGDGMAGEIKYAPQISEMSGIKVTVTPHAIADAKEWDFEVVLETHTRSLSEDLAKTSTLIANDKQYAPFAWKGTPPNGHHRKGVLRFNAVTAQPQSVELQIRLAGEEAPRKFSWVLHVKQK